MTRLLLALLAAALLGGCLINTKLYNELREDLPPECGTDEAEENPDLECIDPAVLEAEDEAA